MSKANRTREKRPLTFETFSIQGFDFSRGRYRKRTNSQHTVQMEYVHAQRGTYDVWNNGEIPTTLTIGLLIPDSSCWLLLCVCRAIHDMTSLGKVALGRRIYPDVHGFWAKSWNVSVRPVRRIKHLLDPFSSWVLLCCQTSALHVMYWRDLGETDLA